MASLNKVMIIGNLGRDPEIRMAGNTKVANFSVAVTEKFNDRNGQKVEKTEWVNVVLWANLAEVVERYVKKGSSIYVEGKLETTSWDDKDGQKRYKTEVRGMSIQLLGGNSQPTQQQEQRPSEPSESYTQPEVIEDDLPF